MLSTTGLAALNTKRKAAGLPTIAPKARYALNRLSMIVLAKVWLTQAGQRLR